MFSLADHIRAQTIINPPAPANSESEEIGAYEDMIALKKVTNRCVTWSSKI